MSSPALPDRRADWSADERPFVATGGELPARPNIVFVLADDLGWGDLGCYGSLHNSTPNLDALAADGVRFGHAYATSPTCSPTRVSLYTGRYPGSSRWAWRNRSCPATASTASRRTTRPYRRCSGTAATRPACSASGTAAGCLGSAPQRIGFETFFGNMDGVLDYYGHVDSKGTPALYEGEEPVEMEGYYTDLLTERAVGYIRDRDPERPFYMQVNYTAPHWPGRPARTRRSASRSPPP